MAQVPAAECRAFLRHLIQWLLQRNDVFRAIRKTDWYTTGFRARLSAPKDYQALSETVRLLIVEDFVPFRKFIRSVLKEQPDFEIVGESADGEQGVQAAAKLEPDIILLDISMPRMNGLAAARQIRKVSPKSRIIFVTADRSAESCEAAMMTGAAGYIIKWYAAVELVPAIREVLLGKNAFSKSLTIGS